MNDIKTDENDIEKNIKNVKGTLFRWTADSADWYQSVSGVYRIPRPPDRDHRPAS